MVDKRGETTFYTSEDIVDCMKKVTPVQLHQTVVIDGDIEITAFYAGHVLGVPTWSKHAVGVCVSITLSVLLASQVPQCFASWSARKAWCTLETSIRLLIIIWVRIGLCWLAGSRVVEVLLLCRRRARLD